MKDFNETQDTLHLVNAWRRNIIGFGESTVPSDWGFLWGTATPSGPACVSTFCVELKYRERPTVLLLLQQPLWLLLQLLLLSETVIKLCHYANLGFFLPWTKQDNNNNTWSVNSKGEGWAAPENEAWKTTLRRQQRRNQKVIIIINRGVTEFSKLCKSDASRLHVLFILSS